MTLDEFKASLAAEEIEAIKAIAGKSQNITDEEKETYSNYINKSSEALGEDQVAEPIRYIVASMGGLRSEDLQYLIGEDFDADVFEQWNNLLETPILTYRDLPGNNHECVLVELFSNGLGLNLKGDTLVREEHEVLDKDGGSFFKSLLGVD